MNATTEPGMADICLLLEGTYPYVRGGVATWTHQLINALPDLRFALFFIGSDRKSTRQRQYELPRNVISLDEIYLFEQLPSEELRPNPYAGARTRELCRMVDDFYKTQEWDLQHQIALRAFDWLSAHGRELTYGNLCQSEAAWQILVDAYLRFMPEHSFIDFFWTSRFLHLPLWQVVARSQNRVPLARLYHTICTGYAGLLAALISRRNHAPMLLTEHGIYTKERILEITQADWIYEPDTRYFDLSVRWRRFKEMWISLFTFLGRMVYLSSTHIVSLYDGNAALQLEYGAPPAKLEVIPNGIDPSEYQAARELRKRLRTEAPERQVIGFIGRVVSIKDVKTLLRSMPAVLSSLPKARLHIYGPMDEEPEYVKECQDLVHILQLDDQVRFLGSRPIVEILPEIDILALTSISEGLPLVLLEGFAATVPAVTTDVGACRELIFGRTPSDRNIGYAGFVTPIASPPETAHAVVKLLRDRTLQDQMGDVGLRRVLRFYRQNDIIRRYRELYTTLKPSGTC
jgi:glycosyltransferase involved in cell wall biosynthesis